MSIIQANDLVSITWIFSPGHADVVGNEKADVLAGTAYIRGALMMELPAFLSAVREMLSDIRYEDDSYTLMVAKASSMGQPRCGQISC